MRIFRSAKRTHRRNRAAVVQRPGLRGGGKINRILATYLLFLMALTGSGGTEILVVCFGPDGHMAIEWAHGGKRCGAQGDPMGDGVESWDAAVTPSCTDIPLAAGGEDLTRPDRGYHRLPPAENLPRNPGDDGAYPGLAAVNPGAGCRDGWPRITLDSLQSTVLLI